jgi:hypothetical protein
MLSTQKLGQLRQRDDFADDVLSHLCPHTIIRNLAFRHFWSLFVSPQDSIRKISLVSKLTITLSANSDASSSDPLLLPVPPFGYGLSESEVILLLRGAPRGFLEEVIASIDLDNTGMITATKADVATRGIPVDMSLRDTLLFLAHQCGSKVLLPPPEFDDTKLMMISTIQSVQPEAAVPNSKKSSRPSLIRKLMDMNIYSIAAQEMIKDEIQVQILEMMTRASGWGVVVGEASVGKTFRVISAGRQFLADHFQLAVEESSGDETRTFLHRKEVRSFMDRSKGPNLRRAQHNLFYLDLAGCRVKCEVYASLAMQLGLSRGEGVGGLEEAEQRLTRFLGALESLKVLSVGCAFPCYV